MPAFGVRSSTILKTCHTALRSLFVEVVKTYDCKVIQGGRSIDEEMQAIRTGHSKLLSPTESKHVIAPGIRTLSDAVDVAPYPVVWPNDGMSPAEHMHAVGRFYHFAGYVLRVAEYLGTPVRWGGDWNGDLIFSDQTFDDLDHFEVIV